MGTFIISRRTNGEFQYRLRADNHETILSGEGYTSKASCEHGIASVREHAPDESRYSRETASNGEYYFNLKAANGEIIGVSERYASATGRDKGIASVRENAPGAAVEDQSV